MKRCRRFAQVARTFVHLAISSYHLVINSSNEGENLPAGNFGASSFTTCFNCSNGVPHVSYGNFPVANSTREIPNDQTSDLISYCDGLPVGSILSGYKKDNGGGGREWTTAV